MDSLIHIRNDAGELRLLFDICQTLEVIAAPEQRLEKVLALLARHTAMQSGTVLLLNPDRSIRREAGFGLLAGVRYPAYPTGADAVNMVLETAVPAAVPTADSPAFTLDLAAAPLISAPEKSAVTGGFFLSIGLDRGAGRSVRRVRR